MSLLGRCFFILFSLFFATVSASQAASFEKQASSSPLCRFLPEVRQTQDLQHLVKQGNPAAMFCIGERYYLGQGVLQNLELAAQWVTASAEQKYLPAEALYGEMLLQGQGLAPDSVAAYGYIRSAAARGNAEAQATLGHLYEKGVGVEVNLKEAAAWYARATMENVPLALFRLGCMYMEGRGVQQDTGQGTLLIFSAALKGQREAAGVLRKLSRPTPESLSLFKGLDMTQTTRNTFRVVMQKNAVPVLREDENYFCDTYSLETIVPQGKQMIACYGQGKNTFLSLLRIDYASETKAQSQKILSDFEEIFGTPTAQESALGFLWNFKQMLLIGQYIPAAHETSLIYIIPGTEGHISRLPEAQ